MCIQVPHASFQTNVLELFNAILAATEEQVFAVQPDKLNSDFMLYTVNVVSHTTVCLSEVWYLAEELQVCRL